MCLAFPGRVISRAGNKVKVDYGSEVREAAVLETALKVGDYVIIQGGIVVEKVPKAQIRKWQDFLKNEYAGKE